MSAFRVILDSSRQRDSLSPTDMLAGTFLSDNSLVQETDDTSSSVVAKMDPEEKQKKSGKKERKEKKEKKKKKQGKKQSRTRKTPKDGDPPVVADEVDSSSFEHKDYKNKSSTPKQEFSVPHFDKRKLRAILDRSDEDVAEKELSHFFSPVEYDLMLRDIVPEALRLLASKGVAFAQIPSQKEEVALIQSLLGDLDSDTGSVARNACVVLLYMSCGYPNIDLNGGKGSVKLAARVNSSLALHGATRIYIQLLYNTIDQAFPRKPKNVAVSQMEQLSPNAQNRRGVKTIDVELILNLFFLLLSTNQTNKTLRKTILTHHEEEPFCSVQPLPIFCYFLDLVQRKALMASSSKVGLLTSSSLSFPLKKVILLAALLLRFSIGGGLQYMRRLKLDAGAEPQVKSRIHSLQSREERAKERRKQLILNGVRVKELDEFMAKDESVRLLRENLHIPFSVRKHSHCAGENDVLRDKAIEDYGTIESIYEWLFPKCKRAMMGLIQVILAASPEDSGYSKKLIDIAADFDHAMAKQDSQSSQFAHLSQDTVEEHRVRDRSYHKSIVARSASQIILLLLKALRQNHVIQGELLCQVLSQSKISLVLLRWMNIDVRDFLSTGLPIDGELDGSSGSVIEDGQEEMVGKNEAHDGEQGTGTAHASRHVRESGWVVFCDDRHPSGDVEDPDSSFPSGIARTRACTMLNLLRILQRVHKHAPPDRIETHLLQYKAAMVLRKVLMCPFPGVQYYALKLIKIQSKYMDKKWKQVNMRIISAIHRNIRADLDDEWLVAADIEQEKEWFSEEDISRAIEAYNDFYHGNGYRASAHSVEDAMDLENIIEGSQCTEFMGRIARCPFENESFEEFYESVPMPSQQEAEAYFSQLRARSLEPVGEIVHQQEKQ